MSSEIEDRLADIMNRGLYRRMHCVSGPQGPRVLLDGKPVLLMCSNNYLGLADHPRVREAAAEAAMRYGAGSGASRLVSGNMTIHRRLEDNLAGFKGSDACLLFGSGYLANAGVVSAHNKVTSSKITANDCVPNRFPRPRHAHSQRKECQKSGLLIIVAFYEGPV